MVGKKNIALRLFHSTQKATRIVRFIDKKSGKVRFGQPTDCSETVNLIEGDNLYGSLKLTNETSQVKKLLAPIIPRQIIGIGLNYKKHAEETSMPYPRYPVVFMKGINSIAGPGSAIRIPKVSTNPPEVDYEGELAVILKHPCKDLKPNEAIQKVLGYTVANDVSSRRWQGKKGGSQWCYAKSFDTFCPIGPALIPRDCIEDPQNLQIATFVNEDCVQKSSTSDMIFSIGEIISYLSRDTTLPAGTLILTGTPDGVGFTRDPPRFLKPGDTVSVCIQEIGELSNTVVSGV